MMTSRLYFGFLAVGIVLALATYLLKNTWHTINIHDTYLVISAASMSIIILLYFLVTSLLHLILKSYSSKWLTLSNLILVTLPVLYMLYHNSRPRNIGKKFDLQSSIWTEEYIPTFFMLMFVAGNILLLVNIGYGIFKYLVRNSTTIN